MDKQIYTAIVETWKLIKKWLGLDLHNDDNWMIVAEDASRVYKDLKTDNEIIDDYISDMIVKATRLIEDLYKKGMI